MQEAEFIEVDSALRSTLFRVFLSPSRRSGRGSYKNTARSDAQTLRIVRVGRLSILLFVLMEDEEGRE